MKPILKWVGGKTRLLPEIEKRIPEFQHYYEPFVGGAALLLHLQPKNATAADANEELINLYNVVKTAPEELIKDLGKHKNEKEYFYQIRKLDRLESYKDLSPIEKASRILYINKTCYNGLFRVNSRGELNTPFGNYKNPLICDENNIRELSDYFNRANIQFIHQDFEQTLLEAKKGDFVYLDPPYDPISATASFTAYAKNGFSKEEQIRLKQCCDKLDEKDAHFLLSNSATEFICELYEEYSVEIIDAPRSISCNGTNRNSVNEVLISNY